MSGRLPFGRLLYVGGNSETFWNQIVPGLVVVSDESVVLRRLNVSGFQRGFILLPVAGDLRNRRAGENVFAVGASDRESQRAGEILSRARKTRRDTSCSGGREFPSNRRWRFRPAKLSVALLASNFRLTFNAALSGWFVSRVIAASPTALQNMGFWRWL